MKKLSSTLVLIICLSTFIFSPTIQLYGQWVQTNGPYGGLINCFAFSGDNIFAGTPNGVFLSTNNGTKWMAVNNGLTNNDILSLLVSPSNKSANIFAGTAGGGVFLSTNNGSTWTAVNNGLADTTINTLAVSSDSGVTYIFAGTIDGIFRSSNNGLSWTETDTGMTIYQNNYNYISSIVTASVGVNSGSEVKYIYTEAWDGIYYSTNNGNNWVHANATLNYLDVLAVTATSEGTNLYAATTTGVSISKDNGISWINSNLTNVQVNALVVFPSNTGIETSSDSTNIFAGTPTGIYHSTDNGMSWSLIDTGLTNTNILSLAVNSTLQGYKNIYAGTKGGAFLYNNNGNTWIPISTGITDINVRALLETKTGGVIKLFAGTNLGIYLSTDEGADWTKVLDGVSTASFANFSDSAGIMNIFAGTEYGIYRSTNSGITWTQVLPPNVYGWSFAVTANGMGGTNILAGTYGKGIYLSTDEGNNWTNVGGNMMGPYILSMAVSPSAEGGTNIFAYAFMNGFVQGIFLSTDYGESWNFVLHIPFFQSFAVSKYKLNFSTEGTNLFAGIDSGVYISSNYGTTWTYNGLSDYSINSLVVSPNYNLSTSDVPNIFAGTNGGVFLYKNNDTSWNQVNEGLTNIDIHVLAIDSAYLFAGNSVGGIWRRPLSEMITVVKETKKNIPVNYSLQQNYPNPFNPSTVISWQLAVGSFVTLKVYDILGREIRTLVNEYQKAGMHSLIFNANGLSSGIYFYKISTGSYSDTKKLVLIK